MFLKLERVSELPEGLGKMKIAGCHSVSRSLVVSAEKTIIEDEVMVSMLVKILGTSKTGLMCKDYLGGSAFGRKWRRSQERM